MPLYESSGFNILPATVGDFSLHESVPFLKVTNLEFLKGSPTGHGLPFSLRSLLGALKPTFLQAAPQSSLNGARICREEPFRIERTPSISPQSLCSLPLSLVHTCTDKFRSLFGKTSTLVKVFFTFKYIVSRHESN